MKTSRIFAICAAATLIFSSCAKELSNQDKPERKTDGQLTLVAGLDETKVALGEKSESSYPLTWSEGDYLVLEGVKSNELTAAQAGTAGASFTFEGEFTAPYNVIYGGKEGTADVAVFPATQTYTAGTFAPFSAPLYGTGNIVEKIKMHSLNSVLRIPLSQGDTTISKVLVETQAGEILSGDFTLNKTAGAFDGTMTAPTEGKTYVTLDCGEGGVSLADGEVSFFVSIPAGNYANGFKIYVINSQKQAMILSIGSLKTAVAGKVYELPAKEFVAGNTYVIANADDMDILPTLIHDGTTDKGAGKEVILIDDIDMTGKAWTSCGSGGTWANAGNFTATLDGKGHTIKGLTMPLFGNFAGTLKNITVDSNIDWTAIPDTYKGSSYGFGIIAGYAVKDGARYSNGTGLFNVTTKGSMKIALNMTHNIQMGGLVGCCNGLDIKNCTNKANLDIDVPFASNDKKGIFLVGGVCGHLQTYSPTFTDNTNEGNITCKLTTSGNTSDYKISYSGVAGVIGKIATQKSGVTVSGLTNKGKISVSGTGTQSGVESGEPGGQHIAGVCSYYQIANAADNWKNEGEIHCSVNCSTTGSYVAGVLGRVSIANTNLSNFTNSGNIYIDEGYKFGYCGIGGVVALVKNVSVFDGLQNNGEIIANESIKSQTISHARIGGIIGHIESVSSTTVKNSINNGAINIVNGNSTTGCAIGGVVGNAKATTFTGTNNVNTGNVTYDGTNTSGSLQIGGVYGRIETNNANTTVSIEGVTGTDSNSGIITLNDTTGCSKTPAAGGVIGSIYGYKSADSKTIYKMTLTLNNCKNTGKIYRKVSNYTYESATYTDQYAGGIVGNASTQIGGTISNCINTAEIRFSKDSGGKSAFTTATQIKGYIGGIGGRVGADNYITIQNCHNSGNIPSIEGFCGGIVGYGWSISILGEKGNYCTNTGDIAHREGAEIASLQSTAGGILGGGSTKVTLEWCYNTGTVAGDKGGCAGIVGRVNNKTAAMTVKYCKTFCKINSSSDWARSGFIFGYTSAQEDATELLKNVKYVAVGGQYRYGGEYSTPTSENYVNHLYYNKTTASDAAQKSSAATATITVEKAAEYEITLWDGTSEISWEK